MKDKTLQAIDKAATFYLYWSACNPSENERLLCWLSFVAGGIVTLITSLILLP